MAARPNAREAESLARDGRAAGEQAALRRVAVLVARAAAPDEVFTAVTAEVGRVLEVGFTYLSRYDPDGVATVLAAWAKTGAASPARVGDRFELAGRNLHALVFRTRRPARIDDYANASGPAAAAGRAAGMHSAVGAPVSVAGRLWGLMIVGSTAEELLPSGTEARLAGFTELVATAIANAQARLELRGFAEEQAALRRVATLVAQAAPPQEVFSAVTAEIGRVLEVGTVSMNRYDPDGATTVVGLWGGTGAALGTRVPLGGRNVLTLVSETGRTARIDGYGVNASGPAADLARRYGVLSSLVAVPIRVEGRLWGVAVMAFRNEESPPADIEARLAGFTELVATAIANAEARLELRRFAEEQAVLRRIASLVARGVRPQEVFATVVAEIGRVMGVQAASMNRYDPDGLLTIVGYWGEGSATVGMRVPLGGHNVSAMVFETGRAARIGSYKVSTSGPAANFASELDTTSLAGTPIMVEGRLWGVMIVASMGAELLPADTEMRLAGFTELVGTAIANTQAREELAASRARIVAAADQTRRRIERDLHDGVQQRLVSHALHLRAVQAAPPPATELAQQLDGAVTEVNGALEELREIARGLHPAILAEGGLRPALKTLARRSAVPVRLDVGVARRLPDPVEIAAYYAVSESLTNTAKHARASVIDVQVKTGDGALHVHVRDDGRGGADFGPGSGLVGLTDRIEALGGRLSLHSPPGAGTTVQITLPLDGP